MAQSIEPVDLSKHCVWCWKEIEPGQAVLTIGENRKAHLGCDSRMLNFIENLGEWTE